MLRHRDITLHHQHAGRQNSVADPALELARIEIFNTFRVVVVPSPDALGIPYRGLRGHAHAGGDVVSRVEPHGGQPHANALPAAAAVILRGVA